MSRVSLNKSQYGSRRVRKISSVRFVYGYNCVAVVGYIQKSILSFFFPFYLFALRRFLRDSFITGCDGVISDYLSLSKQRFKKALKDLNDMQKNIRMSFENVRFFHVVALHIHKGQALYRSLLPTMKISS